MDGVLVHEENALPGADDFIRRLGEAGKQFLVLTNNSIYTPRDLQARLHASGIDIPATSLWTSALATAQFLNDQRPGGSAFVVGEAGLTTALHDIGYILTDRDPDYVVIGETRTYSFEAITRAIRLIQGGARYIVTNPDATGPSPEGTLPAAGSVAALITHATRKDPYFVGKPNPLMIRAGLNTIGAHSETTAMIGDRMDTDMVAGMEAGLHTILVLSGVTDPAEMDRYPVPPEPGGAERRPPRGGRAGLTGYFADMPEDFEDLPSTLQRSPESARKTYAEAKESAEGTYGKGERASRTAYSALKHTHEKVGDHWEPKEEKGPSDSQAPRAAAANPSGESARRRRRQRQQGAPLRACPAAGRRGPLDDGQGRARRRHPEGERPGDAQVPG